MKSARTIVGLMVVLLAPNDQMVIRPARAEPAAAANSSEQQKSAFEKVDEIFAKDYSRHPYGGMTVGVVLGNKLVWTNSYGLADAEHRVPASKDTVYRIGSITKQFTAIMLLQLEKKHRVAMSDPVEKYFPQIRTVEGWPSPEEITLFDLATHRGGLAVEPDGCVGAARTCSDQVGPVSGWVQSVIIALPHVKLEIAPETQVFYSNIGYAVLGAALGRAAGQPYIDYMNEHIIIPLGMAHTGFEASGAMLKSLARGYTDENGSISSNLADDELKNGRGYKVPNGGLFTTVGDLSKFVSLEMGEGPQNVISRSTLSANYKRYYPWSKSPGGGYGVGFSKVVQDGKAIFGHGGATAGYRSAAFFDPDAKIGVICLRNADVPCNAADQEALVMLLKR